MRSQQTSHLVSALIALGALVLTSARASAESFPWDRYQGYPTFWYEGFEAKQIAANVLSHQTPQGTWPKNIDTGAKAYDGDFKDLRGTFEGGATVGELRFLARIYGVTRDQKYLTAVDKGLKNILDAQYRNGGWPHSFPPPPKSYERRIAFHDYTMVNLLLLMREVADSKSFAFVRKEKREAAKEAFDRGVECIVKCQVKVNDDLTGWCARYHEKSLQPEPGRKFEPKSISATETAGILIFLMSLENPDAGVVRAVNTGCEWLDTVKLPGIRILKKDGDLRIGRDDNAPPLWSRLYEIGTNRPMFAKRDGTIKYKLADIDESLRTEVAWYGSWGRPALAMYAKWKDKQ